MNFTDASINDFRECVWSYYASNARSMPWRGNTEPYWVMVSEVMLQQTQVRRVEPKFIEFIHVFPSVEALANSSLAEVLTVWSGLGYNRRAKFLWEAANQIKGHHQGVVPRTTEELIMLPGIGRNTAAAIAAYAYGLPTIFIETNIRTVLLHHFFPRQSQVSDAQLLEVAQWAFDMESPREWYWAMMDYGNYLKSTQGGHLDQSIHYKKQSPLAGSMREMRGRIIRSLAHGHAMSDAELRFAVEADERYQAALGALVGEGMVIRSGDTVNLTGHTTVPIIESRK